MHEAINLASLFGGSPDHVLPFQQKMLTNGVHCFREKLFLYLLEQVLGHSSMFKRYLHGQSPHHEKLSPPNLTTEPHESVTSCFSATTSLGLRLGPEPPANQGVVQEKRGCNPPKEGDRHT